MARRDDILRQIQDMARDFSGPTPEATKRPEKGVPWRARVIDGEYYVPLSQVADLIEINNVLPAVARGIRQRVKALSEKEK